MTQDEGLPHIEPGVEANLARHGKVSYIQFPARNALALGAFYAEVFGWSVGDDSAHVSFSDASGDLIGAFVADLSPSREPGILPYIYVEGIDATIERVEANGGSVVRPPYPEGDLWVATCRDPAENVIGLWQGGPR